MTKTLAILGIAGAIMAVLAGLVFVDMAAALPPLFAIGAAIVLFWDRSAIATTLGVVTILVALAALGGALGSISFGSSTGSSKGLGFGVPQDVGRVLSVAACLLVTASVILLRRSRIEPAWMAVAGLIAVVLAVVLASVAMATLTQQTAPLTLVFAFFAIVTMVPAIALLRGPTRTAAPTAPRSPPAAMTRTARK